MTMTDEAIDRAIERHTPRRLDLPDREKEISMILAICFEVDQEVVRLLGVTFEDASSPHHVSDLAHVSLGMVHSQLATVLYDPIARLVDRCLDVSEEWTFDQWTYGKQAQKVRELFAEAGIEQRFAPPHWATNDTRERAL